jgi:hypothetical protein
MKVGDTLVFSKNKNAREWRVINIDGLKVTCVHEFVTYWFTKGTITRIIELQPGTILEEIS